MAVSNLPLADRVWNTHAWAMNHGFTDYVMLDSVVTTAIGTDGIALIAERFQ